MERICLTPKEIADLLGKSTSWVYDNASKLGGVKIGGSWIFTEEGLKAVLQAKLKPKEPPKVPPKIPRYKKRLKSDYGTDPAAHGIASYLHLISSKEDEED